MLALSISWLVFSISIVHAQTITYDLTYDAQGNLQQSFDRYIEYNEFNQVVRVRETDQSGVILEEYAYDESGVRLTKYEPQLNQTTYYISDDFIEIVNATGSYLTTYYHESNTLVARQDANGEKFFYHPDHLGSTDTVTNQSGNVVEETTYKPYGETIDGGDSTFLYNSKELDTNTNMYYYGARYYDPFFRKFTQPDTNIPELYNPQDLNRYSYVRNNPYKYVDPSGENPVYASIVFATATLSLIAADYAFFSTLGEGIRANKPIGQVLKNSGKAAIAAGSATAVAVASVGLLKEKAPLFAGAPAEGLEYGLQIRGIQFITGLFTTNEETSQSILPETQSSDAPRTQEESENSFIDVLDNSPMRKNQRVGTLKRKEGVSSIAIGRGVDGRTPSERRNILISQGRHCGPSCATAALVRQGRLGHHNQLRAKLIEQGRG